ncbi:MAG: dihydrodipicolinate reductase C-terminal domain-containing protein [Selenomonadaceae bacterium]
MKKIKIGLLGFGKTGKPVANEIIQDSVCDLSWVVREQTDKIEYASHLLGYEFDQGRIFSQADLTDQFFRAHPVDVIVDFSRSEAVREYQGALELGIPVVSAISQYNPEDLAMLKSYADRAAIFYSPNITIGVNILMVVAQILQRIAPHADIEIIEEHFREKKEVSGTAKKMADILGMGYEKVHSIRVGKTVGKHKIIFGLPNQTIRLIHESVDRAAFGQGAIFAAKYVVTQLPGIYTMEQIISEMFMKNIPVY